MSKDLHKSPFDDATKSKLAIFRDYLREWLPVFIAKREIYWDTVNIFDFFAGPGSDTVGNKGTPLIIIQELAPFINTIVEKKLKINLYFNEFNRSKCNDLRLKLVDELKGKPYSSEVESLDFHEAYTKKLPMMTHPNCVNLLFLDQNGVKHISESVFKQIIGLKRTDFLFFISSSTIKRFSEHPSIAQYLNLSSKELEKTPYHHIHRLVVGFYRNLIPPNKDYYLASFSLKKPSGVYGLIFGSNHVLGIEKFLTTCWNIDPERGEANFDIDDDSILPGQFDLFTGSVKKPKKVDLFEKELRDRILDRRLTTDKDVYLFTLENSFTPSHSRKVIRELINQKKISDVKLNISSKVCKANSTLTTLTVL